MSSSKRQLTVPFTGSERRLDFLMFIFIDNLMNGLLIKNVDKPQ